MTDFQDLLKRNREWAKRIEEEEPGFFHKLSRQQSPEFLWIGCSDSRVPANQVVDLTPGEVFVHRNIANVVSHSDLNCLSVVQFAVDVLQVKHILVVGHYGCGGVGAVVKGQRVGLADNWLRYVEDVRDQHESLLNDRHLSELQRHDTLCELNALEQAENVTRTTVVKDAWARGQDVSVHAWVYSLANGHVTDLAFSADSMASRGTCYSRALRGIRERATHTGK